MGELLEGLRKPGGAKLITECQGGACERPVAGLIKLQITEIYRDQQGKRKQRHVTSLQRHLCEQHLVDAYRTSERHISMVGNGGGGLK